jgi:uncharacterized OsmC-like protein
MADQATIREIAERNIQLLAMRPTRGLLSCTAKARLRDGLCCEITEGPWRLAADMPAKAGGEETAPTPGVLGRAALASCLVIGIATWSARLGIPIDDLEVAVHADFNARGELGADDDVRPGYTSVRYEIAIDSPAPRERLVELLDLAERHSPYLDVFSRPMAMSGSRRLNGQEA